MKGRRISVIFITHNIYRVYVVTYRFVMLKKVIKVGDFEKK